MGYCNKSIMLGRGPAPGVELRVAIQVVRRRLGDEFREPAESELSAGRNLATGVRGPRTAAHPRRLPALTAGSGSSAFGDPRPGDTGSGDTGSGGPGYRTAAGKQRSSA